MSKKRNEYLLQLNDAMEKAEVNFDIPVSKIKIVNEADDNGYVKQRMDIVIERPSDNFKNYKPSDFDIQVLMAAGLDKELKFATISMSKEYMIERAEAVNSEIAKMMINNNVATETQPAEATPNEEVKVA